MQRLLSNLNYFKHFSSMPCKRLSHISVLSHGEPKEDCQIKLIVNASSWNESSFPSGMTHFLKCLSYHSSVNYPSKIELHRKIKQLNATVDCQTTREDIIYCINGKSNILKELVDILGEAVLHQIITEEDLQSARTAVAEELKSISIENWIIEAIFHSTYRVNTVGLPYYCLPENVDSEITRSHLITFLSANFRPEIMSLHGTGVTKSHLDEAAKVLLEKRPPWIEGGDLHYLVDEMLDRREEPFFLPNSCLRIHPLDIEDTFVAMSFSSVAPSDPFFELFLLLQDLSNYRLSETFTAKNTWSCHLKFSRGSVLTAIMKCDPSHLNESIHDLVDHWKSLTITPMTLEEAKALNAEKWFQTSAQSLTEDLRHAAQHLFHSNPAVAIIGNTEYISSLISYNDICSALYVSQDNPVKFYDLVK